jgi:pimeloyl-ACP methyl ester carboxylesterase
MLEFEDTVLHANGLSFSALTHGEGPIVLCLHGFPDYRRSYRLQMPALAKAGFRAVAPSLRGYEPSSQPPDHDYHVVRMAEDVVGWIDSLGADRVHLVGHDWGAIIAYAAAALAPERLYSLTTLAVPDLGGLLRHKSLRIIPRQFRRSWYILFFQLPWLPEAVLQLRDGALIDKLWRDWSPGWTPPARELEIVKTALSQPGVREATLAYYRSLFSAGRQARHTLKLHMRPILTPTLAITGEQDGCIDTRLYEDTMQAHEFPGGLSIERVAGAGHFPHQERPDEVNRMLLAWLEQHTPG